MNYIEIHFGLWYNNMFKTSMWTKHWTFGQKESYKMVLDSDLDDNFVVILSTFAFVPILFKTIFSSLQF